MLYRDLGRTGEQVSALGFGCMRLPVIGGREADIDEPRATELLRYAIDQGVNYIDTAYPYHQGMSEPFLSRALGRGYREKVYLATKLPSWKVSTEGDFDFYLHEQLSRLQTECIDCYLLHNIKREWWIKLYELGVLDFLDRAVKEGKIRYAGFSFHDEAEPFKRIVDSFDWDFCQIQYNYMDEEIQAGREGLTYAARKGLGIVVMEPLRGGSLAKEPPPDMQALWEQAPQQRSPAQWALEWVLDHPEVSVVLSGMNSLEQVEENCRIASRAGPRSLSAEELATIDRIKESFRLRMPIPCTSCGYCLPCPSGVNIPRIFSIYNDRFIYGDQRWTHLMYTIGTNADERADQCAACGECEEACPQSIAIPEKLRECHEILVQPYE